MDSAAELDARSMIQKMNDFSMLYSFSTLEYLLKDVKIIYLKDIRISIDPFLFLNAKEGDMGSIPRWLATILNRYDLIEIHDEDHLSYIKRALNRERISANHELSSIDPDFYVRVNNYLRLIDEKDRDSLIVSLNPFIATRLQKIAKISSSSSLIPEIEQKLSIEEKLLYENFYNMTLNFKKKVLDVD